MKLTVEQLVKIMPNVDRNWAPEYVRCINDTAKMFGINTPLRMAAWLANGAYETGELHYWRELSPPGGLAKYYGRGFLHLTHPDNYSRAGKYLGLDLLNNPDLVASDTQVGFDTAGWFWRYGNGDLNVFADQGDFYTTYTRILGGDNGSFPRRKVYYDRALEVLKDEETVWPEKVVQVSSDGWAYVDEGLWLRAKPGLLFTADEDGWLKQESFEPPRWEWPEASVAPRAGNYQDRHPTRYNWLPERPDVEAWARYLVDNYDVSVNTYYDHPEGFWRDKDSFDVWGPQGRNDWLDPDVGDEVFNVLFYDPNKPDIDWIIYKRRIYHAGNNWQGEPFGDGSEFMNHDNHLHVSYE